ncbi:MAG: type I toxin-antitoxin system SymE family toxin [Lachnospiraceae bacterium]|nr:type I toxin-antitoxin system SymE family toxin [Lachnospiraceae bacterium]
MENKIRKLTVVRSQTRDYKKNIPAITLQGLWFKDWGFNPGDKIEVSNKKYGEIILRKAGSIIDSQ